MDRSFLLIVAIVFVVGLVGFLTVKPLGSGITGNVIVDAPSECDTCEGTWVCAAKDKKVSNYPSACAASCDGARIILDDVCERLPHANE